MSKNKLAFPTYETNVIGAIAETKTVDEGMTLRDYFAAKAMAVDYANIEIFKDAGWRMEVAIDAYKMADAMLIAREIE